MKEAVFTKNAPAAIGPYSQGMKAGNMLFTAGQIGIIPETGELYKGDIKGETKLVMQHLQAILKEAGMDFSNVIKCSIFLSDLNDFAAVNEIYGSCFEAPYPVRETVEVSKLPKAVNVEISLVAMAG